MSTLQTLEGHFTLRRLLSLTFKTFGGFVPALTPHAHTHTPVVVFENMQQPAKFFQYMIAVLAL